MPWFSLSKKKILTVAGLSSGTSADGVDIALARISHLGGFKVRQLYFSVARYPSGLRRKILDLASAKDFEVDQIGYLNYLLGDFFARTLTDVLKKTRIKPDLIGSHGQTIRHLPEARSFLGKIVKATWQIGEAEVIAKKTGLVTVSDFRAGDVALSGQGAPLTPYVNYLLFGNQEAIAVLNIGGIANISAWEKGAKKEHIIGFDCGPGNMAVDRAVKILFSREYDKDGQIASAGRVDQDLLAELKEHKFFAKKPPKSTGQEEFGRSFVEKTLKLSEGYEVPKEDIITTLSELTVEAIWDSYHRFIAPRIKVEQIFVTGGGLYNLYFLKRLKELFRPIRISNTQTGGYNPKALEAISFAVLAYLAVHNLPANLPQVTGARRQAVLGKVSLP